MPRSSRRPPRPPTALSEAVDRLTRQATERGWRPATECLSGKVCYPSAAAASAAAYYARESGCATARSTTTAATAATGT